MADAPKGRFLRLIDQALLPKFEVFGRDLALSSYRRYLGRSFDGIFYDAGQGLFPNALFALSGALRSGGDFCLFLPEDYVEGDPDHWRFLPEGVDVSLCRSYFNQRFKRLYLQSSQNSPLKINETMVRFVYDQAQVFLGARGSGKTTALADKACALLARGLRVLWVAPFRESYAHILGRLPSNFSELLLFLPPDEALKRAPCADVLFVDEVGSVAPKQLLALLARYPLFTLAGTLEGYEGYSGDFLHKILPSLDSVRLDFLRNSYRFLQGDALSALMNAVFLNEDIVLESDVKINGGGAVFFRVLSREDLFLDEGCLRALWRLLREAHYRNRAEDLKALLDLPYQHLLAAFTVSGECVGALLLQEEPFLSCDLAKAVLKGERRPRGRILRQLLLVQSGDLFWNEVPLLRVQRIAVDKYWRRQGLGSRLLFEAEKRFVGRLGVVYSANNSVDEFWQKNDFAVFWQSDYVRSRNSGATTLRIRL